MFALIQDGAVKRYPYSLSDIKLANPNTSFPSVASDATMAEYGAMRVYFSTRPELTDTQVLEEDTPVFSNEDQRWTQVLRVRDMTVEEVTSRNDTQAAQVRAQRDTKLAETDWIVIKNLELNANIPGAWEVYRQALRDVPTQSGFPWTITWPVQP
jgi:hypothetical protein